MRRVELEFGVPVEASVFDGVPGVRDVVVEDHRASFSYDGKMDVLLKAVAGRYDLVDITTEEADLEEIFLTYYRDEEVSV
jgi:ABC-2 type transport system ATP-binding protein